MKKTISITATVIAASLFAASASAAGDKQAEDIVHGHGKSPSSTAEMYVQFEAAPKEVGDFLLWNLSRSEGVTRSDVYVQGRSNQDNRDDLRDRV